MAENDNPENEKSEGDKKPYDFKPMEEYYETLAQDTVYSEEFRAGKVFGVKNKTNDEEYIRLLTSTKSKTGWRKKVGFNVYNLLHIDKLFSALRTVAKAIGWKVSEASDIEEIKKQLREKQETIVFLEKQNSEARIDHEKLLHQYLEQKDKLMRSRIDEFKQTAEELKVKIANVDVKKIPESDLQEFLYLHAWLFGTEYLSAEPQKMRGAHSKFDFYLERYNKTKDIVEIKLMSENIINQDGSISANVIQAVDQLIEYLESSIAAAHSTVISAEEDINELRPRGIVIIGKNSDKKAKEKLCKWNYRMNHIQIITYNDVLDRAQAVIKHIEKQEVIINAQP
ncbi:MAG: DUF4263 domain-containing protein [Candidatus Aenigmarchaeota archaeon]|nr:DUF4263 domain-containing protein [Candidatus Aenigmarchaeota archaeon]